MQDTTGQVSEAWTGPQVAWKMARGGEGSFGGKTLLKPYVWLAFCLVFLLGLADLRRPLSVRNLDLLLLLGFTVSLAFFDRGEIFRSVPAVYPVLAYLLARGLWVGFRGRSAALSSVWPTWVLAAAVVFLLGFRVGLNLESATGGHRRRARGSRRRRPDPRRRGAVREHAAARRPEAVRPGGRRGPGAGAHPDERPLRGRDRARRHVRPRLLPRLRPGGRGVRLEREVGLAPSGARHVDRLRPAGRPRAPPHRCALRRAASRRPARVRLGRVPVHRVHAEREHERRDHAGLPPRGLLAPHLGLGARRVRRTRRLDEVRRAPRRAAVGDVPRLRPSTAAPLRARVRRRDGARVLDPPARALALGCASHVLAPHDRIPVGPRLAVLDLGLGPVPRAGNPRPRLPPARRRGRRRGARGSCSRSSRGGRGPFSWRR